MSRRARDVRLCALLGVSLGVALVASAGAPVPAPDGAASAADGPVLQAVASYDGRALAVDGVQVVGQLPAVGAAVVRGDAEALRRLATTPGVHGVTLDGPLQLTGGASRAGGVLASAGLGAGAGTDGSGAGVRVAVVDTGVSDTAALSRSSGRLVDGVDTRQVDDGGPPVTEGVFDDGHGHGTFMASLVAGGPVDGSGGQAVGVAPGATVVVVRVAEADGTTSLSQVLAGLAWVASHPDDVDVASLSLSRQRPEFSYGADPLTDAVERVRASGTSIVVSAGNQRGTVGDPGFDPRVLTVGAVDVVDGRVARDSGSDAVLGITKPDVVANGVSVLGVLPEGSLLAQQHPTARAAGELWRGSGTSQATAVTSGAAALLLAAHPDATPAQVKASLRESAVDLDGRRDGQGSLRGTLELVSGPDGTAPVGGADLTGEVGIDASSWAASSWAASSWAASSWDASSWAASSWAASSWAASSWDASSWAASSWAASSWAASSWAASSWAASSWAASSWAASSWAASSWASSSWGDPATDGQVAR